MNIYKVKYVTDNSLWTNRILYTDIPFNEIEELIIKTILHSSTELIAITSAKLIKADIYKVIIQK